jgi:hypothetical protein
MAVVDKSEYATIYLEHGESISKQNEGELNRELNNLGINAKLNFETTPDGLKIKIEKYPK